MDKFNTKPKDNKRRAIDGILGVRRQPGSTGSINFRRPSSYQPQGKPIDDFKRADGFHAPAQPKLYETDQIEEQPQKHQAKAVEPLHEPLKRKTKRHRLKKHRKAILRSLAGLLILVLLTAGFLFTKGYLKARQIFNGGGDSALALQDGIDPSKLKGEGDGRVNILVMGKGGEGNTAPDLTDTLIVVSIDPFAKDAGLLSIPRDLYVKIPGAGSGKINSVYALSKNKILAQGKQTDALKKQAEEAGLAAIEKTVEDTMGIPIHYYAMIDFEGFKKAIDTVGGVDLNAPSTLYEQMSIGGKPYILSVKPGQQHMDGFKALAYARSRYTSPRGDFDRSERQRLISLALKDKVLSVGTFANPLKINDLLNNFGSHIQSNLSTDEVLKLYALAKEIPSNSVSSLGLADPPNNFVRTDFIGGQSVVVPTAGVGVFSAIQNYVRNTLKDGFIKKENASILVLNGTGTAGKATAKADELKSYGYNVVGVADAPTKTYAKTVLVNLRGKDKRYTEHYLQLRLKTDPVGSLSDSNIQTSNADFVIIVGSD